MSAHLQQHISDTSGFDSPLVWVYAVGVLTLAAFIYRYARYSNWRSTLAGRAIMQLAGSSELVLLYAFFSRLLEPPPFWRVLIGLALIGVVDLAFFRLLHVLVRFQGGWKRTRHPFSDTPHRRATDVAVDAKRPYNR